MSWQLFLAAVVWCAAWFIDGGQTRRIAAEPENWYEHNPILWKHPSLRAVNTYFALGPFAVALLLYVLRTDLRLPALLVLAAVEVFMVVRNRYLGIRMLLWRDHA